MSLPEQHTHTWVMQPDVSSVGVSRYLCSCGAWGYRKWHRRGGKPQPIIVYVDGFDPSKYRKPYYHDEDPHKDYCGAPGCYRTPPKPGC